MLTNIRSFKSDSRNQSQLSTINTCADIQDIDNDLNSKPSTSKQAESTL